jgi:hypothetical protein
LKNSEVPHINKDSTPLCVDAVFHTNFSAAGGTDELVLPATLGQTSRIEPPTARYYASGHHDFHCLGSADET